MSKEISQEPGEPSRASWRDPMHYKSFLTLDRAGWAWKWLRRNPDYVARTTQRPSRPQVIQPGARLRIITASCAEEARDWGLHCSNPLCHGRAYLLASRLGFIGAGR